MKKFFLTWLANSATLILVANFYSGIHAESWKVLIAAALVLGLLNAFVKPFIMLVTLPINVLSLGVFTLFVNGLMFYALTWLVQGFSVNGFWGAFWGALLFSVINSILSGITGARVQTNFRGNRPPAAAQRPVHTGKVIDAEVVKRDE